mmetsp:Transcript_5453/g.16469  ORF Transcript_5453/g.16469 Transcript_5453/m.16469 type:complete len:210 (-) Transcript_5453:564-1193(-)
MAVATMMVVTAAVATAAGEEVCSSTEALPCAEVGFDRLECAEHGHGIMVNSTAQGCDYGTSINATCTAVDDTCCTGARTFNTSMICAYCYQLPEDEVSCDASTSCNSYDARSDYVASCSALPSAGCLGPREFRKKRRCAWTSGLQWSTAFLLSLTLGGFGADRFYLGHIAAGIAKLLTFGGLGVWTVIDVVLQAVGYLEPADGSLLLGS